MLTAACVLRSGGEYKSEHVERLRRQIAEHLPGVPFLCLTDMALPADITALPLAHRWPGWWSKIELFRPDIDGAILYLDLDSSAVGDLSDMTAVNRLAIMRDVYRPDGLQSSVMFLPQSERGRVWREWMRCPEKWMRFYRVGGDQAFLERLWLKSAARWQDILPGQVVSFKADKIAERGVPENARVVAFHGKPRPWDVGW
tara:strand:- start:1623 stop:2222 length:600 start_codon:yes stop_codon:yes gene_type:complete